MTEHSVSKLVSVFDPTPDITCGFREKLDFIFINSEMTFEVVVIDEESNRVDIDVEVDGGSLTKLNEDDFSACYQWTAPIQAGKYIFKISVSDLNNTITNIFPVDVVNEPPIINEIILPQATVKVGTPIILKSDVNYKEPNKLTYDWEFSGGDVIYNCGYNRCEWRAPMETGFVTVTCTATDGFNTVSKETQIEVIENHTPVIDCISGLKTTTIGKKTNYFWANVIDPDKNDTLIYRWEVTGGKITPDRGPGSIIWQAPKTIGDYTITVYVSDDGGVTEVSKSITVTAVPPE